MPVSINQHQTIPLLFAAAGFFVCGFAKINILCKKALIDTNVSVEKYF